jgi:predicted transcriptional regulator
MYGAAITAKLDTAAMERLREIAEEDDLPVAAVIRRAVRSFLALHDANRAG